ncbi:hypothetical protein [Legionella brunensis]|nr:hypothetical protein [Legionella brunensis]
MKDWLKRFFSENQDITLVLNGTVIKKSDCERVGGGSEKNVYKIKGSNQCFFIPHKWRSEDGWNNKILTEKLLLDEINGLGLKTQRFEVSPMEIQEPGQPNYRINVLVTRDFESLCQEESIVIYNQKGDQKVIGIPPDFIAMREQFKDKLFAQKMLKKIVHEYAIAFTFSLPISILNSLDDSEHYCFELSTDATEPPVARYMFWDVVSDFSGINLPLVPTLADLKSGSRESSGLFWEPLRGLRNLANGIACAMLEMNYQNIPDSWEFVRGIQTDFQFALNDDEILNQALEHARELGIDSLNKLLANLGEVKDKISDEIFVKLISSAISVDSLDLVINFFHMDKNPTDLSQKDIDDIMRTAKKYGRQPIIDHLNTHLVLEKSKAIAEEEKVTAEQLNAEVERLKNSFTNAYKEKLTADKKAWCGLYGFFAKSYISEDMSLKELVRHAQGLSNQGSGKRSQQVMREMNWLDENNQVKEEINNLLMKI